MAQTRLVGREREVRAAHERGANVLASRVESKVGEGEPERHERGRTRGVHRDGGADAPERERYATDRGARLLSRGGVRSRGLGERRGVGRRHHPDVDGDAMVADAGAREGFRRRFAQEPVLRVHRDRLRRARVEYGRVERVDVVQESTEARVVRARVRVDVPTRLGDDGDFVARARGAARGVAQKNAPFAAPRDAGDERFDDGRFGTRRATLHGSIHRVTAQAERGGDAIGHRGDGGMIVGEGGRERRAEAVGEAVRELQSAEGIETGGDQRRVGIDRVDPQDVRHRGYHLGAHGGQRRRRASGGRGIDGGVSVDALGFGARRERAHGDHARGDSRRRTRRRHGAKRRVERGDAVLGRYHADAHARGFDGDGGVSSRHARAAPGTPSKAHRRVPGGVSPRARSVHRGVRGGVIRLTARTQEGGDGGKTRGGVDGVETTDATPDVLLAGGFRSKDGGDAGGGLIGKRGV